MKGRFGVVLRERRQERDLSMTDLARMLGVSKSYLSMLESGRRLPSDDQFEAIASALEIPADTLRVAAGRLPPDVSNALADRADVVVSVVRCEDEAARVSFPSRLSPEFEAQLLKRRGQGESATDVPPYPAALRAGKNSQAYRAHSYHTKVPPEAIERLVRHHTVEGDFVVDPFCGSGMAGIAATLAGRNAILSDLSPAAVHIARNYNAPCSVKAFLAAVERVRERVRPTMSWLYEACAASTRSRIEYTVWSDLFECPDCQAEMLYWDGARDPDTGAVTERVKCRQCGGAFEKRALRWTGETPVESNARGVSRRDVHTPTNAEIELIERANAAAILHWYPQVPFARSREMWRAAHTALGIQSVADFYTKRNLHGLAALRHAIHEERDERVRAALLFAFTGIANRASKRYQWNVKRPTNVMSGTLYVSSLRYEWNVWSLFERKARSVARYFEYLGTPQGKAQVVQASATALDHLPDSSADYVFMDPPFGSNIFYADSSLLWEAWLGCLTDEQHEIVVSKRRPIAEGGKSLSDYQRLMTKAFCEVARIMKPAAYATLQFNNSSDEVWCAIQDSISDAGLEVRSAVGLDKIHPSIKGVKGIQAKESIASLDAMIDLRRRSSAKQTATTRKALDLRESILAFGRGRAEPFSTDDVFSHVVRSSISNGITLAGISLLAVKELCSELFTARGNHWLAAKDLAPRRSRNYTPVASPYGCVVNDLLASDEDLRSALDPRVPGPDASGPAPRVVSGQRNTALYNAHSYHTKVPPEAIVPFIRHFTRPGDVVLDPFCGSGMTGVATQLSGRRAVLSDLSVAAAHLAYNHTSPCDPNALAAEFDAIANDLRAEFREIYACDDGGMRGYIHYTLWARDAVCPSCKGHFSIWDAIDRQSGRMPTKVPCPLCGVTTAKAALKYAGNRPVLISYEGANGKRLERPATDLDVRKAWQEFSDARFSWFPDVSVDAKREMYIRSALHLQGIKNVSDFYTPRNLHALARLWERIQRTRDRRVRAALCFAFTNTAWHGTRMRRFNARGGQRPLTGTLYVPQLSSEANVLEVMRNKIRQLRSFYEALGQRDTPSPIIRVGSATSLDGVPDSSIDYVFTDPPFGSNIFYADCNLIWESWLGGLTQLEEEAVVNRSRDASKGGKSLTDYEALMSGAMKEIHRVLKPGAWATLVFHNTDPAVWRSIQSAARSAGFEIEDAGSLDRKQHSHKGYKGRSGKEDVAHFDVIMSMRKQAGIAQSRASQTIDVRKLISAVSAALPAHERSLQRIHSEVIQHLARSGQDLGAVSYEQVRKLTASDDVPTLDHALA